MMDDDTMVAQVLSAHQEKMRDLMSAAESLAEQAIPAMPRFWWYRKIFAGAFHEDL
jgi:hypothetical protein